MNRVNDHYCPGKNLCILGMCSLAICLLDSLDKLCVGRSKKDMTLFKDKL